MLSALPHSHPHGQHVLDFCRDVPKSEMHLHIEGTLEPELVFELAKRNGVATHLPTVEDMKRALDFKNLQQFLDLYYAACSCLLHEQDFFDMTWAYCVKASSQNVRHAEIFFDPQTHTERGVAFSVVITGISRALEQAKRELGMTSALIMCFLKHLSGDDSIRTLEESLPFKDHITAVGLDSTEIGNPPSKFKAVYDLARAEPYNYRCVSHCGEEGPRGDYTEETIIGDMWKTLELLKVERIDHGIQSLRSPELIKHLSEKRIPLTVCPFSNVRLRAVDKLEDHPLKKMMDSGLLVSINSDDPAYFGGYCGDNYLGVALALQLGLADMAELAANSWESSFLPAVAKGARIGDVAQVAERYAKTEEERSGVEKVLERGKRIGAVAIAN
ncbi:adenosine deaminase [Gonapodya prolifera JEL478]|uniref:Adenine deaminase n=1 Tax=Gonapodya prolifera (strain JEL478) TaxID=1344416 RepID=A0A139A3M5_GONPJ|nr:adenosine deaminase [Gonapodya prolifera JEL478]|eukprot:KXS11314.1 adenosine deaminase [Gonapodya prolifera JEL478]